MESKLGSVDFVGKSGTNMNVCKQVEQTNEWRVRRLDPFGWQSMVNLLSLWERTGTER